MKRIFSLARNWYESIVEPFELIKDNFGSLVGYEVSFRFLAFLVLFPILSWAEKLWLVGNNTNVIAWYNIGSFIRNPFSWIVLIFTNDPVLCRNIIDQYDSNIMNIVQRMHSAFSFL